MSSRSWKSDFCSKCCKHPQSNNTPEKIVLIFGIYLLIKKFISKKFNTHYLSSYTADRIYWAQSHAGIAFITLLVQVGLHVLRNVTEVKRQHLSALCVCCGGRRYCLFSITLHPYTLYFDSLV